LAEEQDFDVFVSYAHADNEVPLGSSMAVGWVTAFAKNLNTGPGVLHKRLFIDHQLKPGDNFSADLMTRVERSSVLVLLLSPNYVNSRWCGMEVERFVQAHAADPDKPSNVFVIELWPYESLYTKPPVIERLRKRLFVSKFWFRPADASAPSVAGYPSPLDGQPEGKALYWRVLNELQAAIDQQVLDRRAQRGDVDSQPQPLPVRPARGRLGTVLLADTTDDLEAERNKVRAILEPEGVLVLPEGDYVALSQTEFDVAVQADLAHAGLFVQLLSPTAGRKGRLDLPLPQLQYQRAVASGKPIVQWAARQPAAGDVADEGHARLFETATLRITHLTDFANGVVAALRAEQTRLERAAEELRRQQAEAASDAGDAGNDQPYRAQPRHAKPFIFIDDKAGEPAVTQRVRGLLKEHNYTWRSGEPPNGDMQQWLRPCVAGLTIYTDPSKRAIAQSRLIKFLNQVAEGNVEMEHWGVFLRDGTLASELEIEADGLVDVNEQGLADFLRRVGR
jgi:hypothetical protein